MIERQLRLVDLALDAGIHAECALAGAIYGSLSDDAQAAQLSSPKLAYSPHVPDWRDKRIRCPQQYRRQGLPLGRLDTALDVLHAKQRDGVETLMSFGEFEEAFEKVEPTTWKAVRAPRGTCSSGLTPPRDQSFGA